MTSTIPCCVLTDVQETETLTPFTIASRLPPCLLLWLSQATANHEGSSNCPAVRRISALAKTLPRWHQSTSVGQLPGAEADIRLEGTEEITWEAGTHRQAHRSRFRCLNLWHGHLVGFTFSPGNKVVGRVLGESNLPQKPRDLERRSQRPLYLHDTKVQIKQSDRTIWLTSLIKGAFLSSPMRQALCLRRPCCGAEV